MVSYQHLGLPGPWGTIARIQPSGRFIGAFVKVAVHAEHCPYRSVAKAVCDHFRVLTLGDEERDL